MAISFPSTSVNNDVSFFLDFEDMLTRDQSTVYREDLLVFRDKTDNTAISVADNGGGFLQAINSNGLYTGNKGYLSTTYNSALQLGTNPYTIELIFLTPGFRASITESILSVGATAASNNWEIGIDNLGRPFFIHGTTTETATSATITDDIFQHIAIVRTGTGSNETKMYLNGVAIRTFTDATDYNYTDGLYIGSGRDGSGSTQIYFKNIRVSTVAQYTEDFTATSSLPYVAVGDTYSYLDKVYKWNGVKWFDRSKYNANLPGEYRNYAAVSGSANTTTLDLRSANFFEIDLVAGIDTEVVFENEALSQSFAMRVDQIKLIDEFAINNLTSDGITKDISSSTKTIHISFSSDGKYLFMGESVDFQSDVIRRFTLAPNWDIASIAADSSATASEYNPGHILLSPTGDRITWSILSGTPATYTNTITNWVLPTNLNSGSATLSLPQTSKQYNADGSALYVADGSVIKKYSLSTNWDTSSFNAIPISTSPAFNFTIGSTTSTIQFNSDESRLIVNTGSELRQYEIPVPGDLSSINTANYVFSTANGGRFFQMKPDGTKLYDFDGSAGYTGSGIVRQFTSTDEITPQLITWPLNITWSTGAPPAITGTTLIEFYKYNGTWHGNVITETL